MILRRKNRAGRSMLPEFRLYCKAIVVKTDTQINGREINQLIYITVLRIYNGVGKPRQANTKELNWATILNQTQISAKNGFDFKT